MPLQDHFHPPLYPKRAWESFHARWASGLADWVNERLPSSDIFAEVKTQVGPVVEVDVATFEEEQRPSLPGADAGGIATAVVPAQAWSPPTPPLVMPAVFPDTFEVRVFSTERGGLDLVAAIELASPGNKDRPEERRGFAIKSASYLCQGTSLIMVDIVTSRRANLHNEMMGLLQAKPAMYLPAETSLYAVAYRPVLRNQLKEIDVWPASMALGGSLPLLPFGLTHGLCVPVDFEATYVETCQRLRLPGS